jgi:amino acid transporter
MTDVTERHEVYEKLGAKKLSLPDVVAQSVGFMGPVFSAAFLIPLVAGIISATGKGGGVASPLSVIIASIGVFALGWIVSRYARRIHAAGSLYDYVAEGLGRRAGVAAGWLYYGGIVVLVSGLVLLIGGYLQSTILTDFKVNPLPNWAWSVLVIAMLFGIAYFGVRISTRFQLALALISLTVLLSFFIYLIVDLGHANSARPFNPSSSADGWSGIFFGVLYGVLLFVGFETAANLAEETPNPKREIPIAVMFTVGLATVFYVLAAYAEIAGFHFSLRTLTAAATAPLFALGAPSAAGGYGGVWVDRLLELVVLFDMLAVAIGCTVSSSRGIFAMARDRYLPSPLARVSRRHDTPVGAIVVVIGVCLAFVALNQFWTGLFALPKTPHYFAMFSWGSTFGGFALVVVYLLMSVGAFRSLRLDEGPVRMAIAAIVGVLITGGAIYGSFYKVTSPTVLAPELALAWFAIGIVIALVTRGRRPARERLGALRESGEARTGSFGATPFTDTATAPPSATAPRSATSLGDDTTTS